jgi:hypothetical protein
LIFLSIYLGIKQDDKDDWQEAVTTMAGIYENSHITVAASWSSDSNGGCFSELREPYQEYIVDDTGLRARRHLPAFSDSGYTSHRGDAMQEDWPLLARGWVRR